MGWREQEPAETTSTGYKAGKPGKGNQQRCPLSAPFPHHDISHFFPILLLKSILGAEDAQSICDGKFRDCIFCSWVLFLAWPDFASRVRIIRSVAHWGHFGIQSQKVGKYLILTIDVLPRVYGGLPSYGIWNESVDLLFIFFLCIHHLLPLDFKTSF